MSLATLDSIFIVCSGNTCRSPLAARILQGELEKRGIHNIDIQSRRAVIEEEKKSMESGSSRQREDDVGSFSGGYDASYGGGYGTSSRASSQPMSQGTAAVIMKVFADRSYVSQHRAKKMRLNELASADLVITMSRSHTNTLRSRVEAFTDAKETKVYSFGDLLCKPTLEVPDPFGSDELLLDKVYNSENGLAEEKGGVGSLLAETTSIPSEYFTPEREEELRFQAYKPVYDLLSKIFEQLLLLETLPSLSMEDCLRSEVDSSYREWQREQQDILSRDSWSAKLSDLVTGRKKTVSAFAAYESGDYPTALKLMQQEQSTVVGKWYEFDVCCSDVSAFRAGRNFNSLSARVHDKIHSVVIPALMQGGYTTTQFTLDRAAIERDLGLVVKGVFSQIFPLMGQLERDGAFEVRKLAHTLVSAVQTSYTQDGIKEFYQSLGGN